jgi:hypothetical protein
MLGSIFLSDEALRFAIFCRLGQLRQELKYMTVCLRVFQGMAESERTPGCDSPKPGGAFWQLVSPESTFRLPEAMIFVGSAECDVLVKVSYFCLFIKEFKLIWVTFSLWNSTIM